MQIYKVLYEYNAIATCMDLTLKIASTFINETVTVKCSVSEKETLIHFTYADRNLSRPGVERCPASARSKVRIVMPGSSGQLIGSDL